VAFTVNRACAMGDNMSLGISRTAFRWEDDCLADDPFAGDYGGSGDGDAVLSDKMVTNRKGGSCHMCAGHCAPGTRNRVRTEVYDGDLMRFRWCVECCFAMAVYDRRPSIGDGRVALGDQRRRRAS
jgi:hypothetical protein